jgi:hypothetical protein
MKNHLVFIAFLGLLAFGDAYSQGGYSGGAKPALVNQTPAFDDYFVASSVDKLSKGKGMVVSQFNMNIAEEEYINLRAGGVKATIDDGIINLQFKLMNLDKKMAQAAIDELYAYLNEKLKTEGFAVKDYEPLKSSKYFKKLTVTEPLNGAYTTGIDPGSRPGFMDNGSAKFIGFSANNMPSINIQGMKGAKLLYIGKDMEADVLGFGLSVHFLEWEGSTNSFGKATASYKPQLFFGSSSVTVFPYQSMGYVTMLNQKASYTFGKEFVTETKEGADQSVLNNAKFKTYEITIDNEKFKAALIELGKSYIDNLVVGLKPK